MVKRKDEPADPGNCMDFFTLPRRAIYEKYLESTGSNREWLKSTFVDFELLSEIQKKV